MMMRVLSIIVFIVAFSASTAVPAQSSQTEIDRVQGLIETGELDEALKVADSYIADHPQEPQMRFLKGLILTTKAQWQEAIVVFRTLSNDFPELPAPLNNLAVAYAEVGKYDLALKALKEALQINPDYASAHENLGDIYVTLAALSYQQATSYKEKQQTARAKLKVLGQLIPDLADTSSSVQTTSKSKPQTASIASQPEAEPIQPDEIETFVKAWASAWSSQDVDKYLDFYSDNFQPAGGKSLPQWRSERRYRVTNPEYIRVEILNVETHSLTARRAQATITQRYESNTYRSTTLKDLLLERQGNRWKIVQEVDATSKSKPQTASIASQPEAEPIQPDEIETFVKAWASAWSSQDVDKYLDFYSDNFQPAGGKSLPQWRSERRYLVTNPEYIRVEILNVETHSLTARRAQATIAQRYESNTYRGTALKDLLLEREGDQWKIVQELVQRE